jgi:hypothetical protein
MTHLNHSHTEVDNPKLAHNLRVGCSEAVGRLHQRLQDLQQKSTDAALIS